jgi:enediyne biosynthesis protein E4
MLLVLLFTRIYGHNTSAKPFPGRFEDVAHQAGIRTPTVFGGKAENKYILETTGCGAAFLDYNNDDALDIFLVNGTTLDELASPSQTNRLFRNNRNGTFTDVTVRSGLVHSGWGQGVCAGDYDNDGAEDLFVTYWGQNILYRNQGDQTFAEVTGKAGLQSETREWGAGCAFLDYDRDGHLDLFVTNYIDFDLKTAPLPGSASCIFQGLPINCGPVGLPKAKSSVFHNSGNGSFANVTQKSGIGKAAPSYGLGVLSGDFNNDGWPDVYVANDSQPSYLFWNKGDGSFREGGLPAGVATSSDGRNQSGMGAAAGDYNGDGWLDIFKTNFSDDFPNLYRNLGGELFEEETMAAGLGVNSLLLGWGCGFFDPDNDGWLDILYVNGHVYPEINRLNRAIGYRQPKMLYQNLGNGKFRDISQLAGPGLASKTAGRGCAFGDFDNDGDTDVIVNPINDVPQLLRYDSIGNNHWIQLKLVGQKSNRSAIGARVRCIAGERQQIDEVRSGGSYFSQNDLRVHFGLGSAARVERLEIFWPSGQVDHLSDLAANQTMIIREGQTGRPAQKR